MRLCRMDIAYNNRDPGDQARGTCEPEDEIGTERGVDEDAESTTEEGSEEDEYRVGGECERRDFQGGRVGTEWSGGCGVGEGKKACIEGGTM